MHPPGTPSRRLTWLLVGLQALLVLSVVAGTLVNVFSLRQATLAKHLAEAEAQARVFEDQLTQTLNLANLTLQGLPDSIDLAYAAPLPERAGEQLQAILRRLLFLRSLSIADGDGRIIASSDAANLGRRVATEAFQPQPEGDGPAPFLRLGPPWVGRDFADGRPTTATQPAAAGAYLQAGSIVSIAGVFGAGT